MKTADQLREIANSTCGFADALAYVDKLTTEAAERHERTVTVTTRLLRLPNTVSIQNFCQHLRQEFGVKVDYENDQRDGDYIRITW